MDHLSSSDRSPAIAELLDDAFVVPVDVETAARHLWAIHREARLLELQESAEAELAAPARSRTIPRAAVPMLAILMVMSSSGVAVAASGESVPGDVLYAVKRGTERAQLIFERDPLGRAELQLRFAEERLDEIQLIATSRPQHVPALVEEIVVTLDEVDKAPPEVAARVQPHSQRVRQQTTAEISQLPAPVSQEAQTAMQATEDAIAATSAPPVGTPTATPVPATGESAVAASSTQTPDGQSRPTETSSPATTTSPSPSQSASAGSSEGPAGGKVLDGELIDGVDEEPSPSSSPSPSASPSSSASPSQSASPGQSGQPSSQPSSSQSPSASPSEGGTASPGEEDEGPIVTPRPQPSENDGATRTGEDDLPADQVDDEAAEQPQGDQPQPSSEPQSSEPQATPSGEPAQADAAASSEGEGQPEPSPQPQSGPIHRPRPQGG